MTDKVKQNVISAVIGGVLGLALGITSVHYQEQRREEEREWIKQYMMEQRVTTLPVAGIEEVMMTTVSEATEEEQEELLAPYDIFGIDEYEYYLLSHIVEAEAGNQGIDGKRLVVDVVFNRVMSDQFPNSVEEVLTQDGQFTTYINGAYELVEPSEDTHEAIAIEYDYIRNTDVYFFRTDHYHSFGKPLFVEEDHYFSGLGDEEWEHFVFECEIAGGR